MNDNTNKKKNSIKEEVSLNDSEKNSKEEELEKEIAEFREKNLLLLANAENQRKQYQEEVKKARKYGNEKIILLTLDFLDYLGNFLMFAQKEKDDKTKEHLFVFEKMKSNFEVSLEKEEVREIKIELRKQQIDSHLHEVIDKVEDNDLSEGTIVEVIKKGYFFHERVLRASQVKISEKPKTTKAEKTNNKSIKN